MIRRPPRSTLFPYTSSSDLPNSPIPVPPCASAAPTQFGPDRTEWELRSEEHTSELQSPDHLVFRLLLEKKNDAQLHHFVEKGAHAFGVSAIEDRRVCRYADS